MQINPTVSAIENVHRLVEDANPGLDLTTANVTLGTPIAYDGSATGDNTHLTITAIADQGFSGEIEVSYRRLEISETNPPASGVVVDVSTTATTQEILDAVGTVVGIVSDSFTLTAVGGGTLIPPSVVDEEVTAEVHAPSTSLLYIESISPYTVTLKGVA